jgi:protein-arginine kinase activator protein McsA
MVLLLQNGVLCFVNATLYYSTILQNIYTIFNLCDLCAHETSNNDNFKIFIKSFSLNFNLKQLYINFILNFGCESSKASD